MPNGTAEAHGPSGVARLRILLRLAEIHERFAILATRSSGSPLRDHGPPPCREPRRVRRV